jgi:hypothetical protein
MEATAMFALSRNVLPVQQLAQPHALLAEAATFYQVILRFQDIFSSLLKKNDP